MTAQPPGQPSACTLTDAQLAELVRTAAIEAGSFRLIHRLHDRRTWFGKAIVAAVAGWQAREELPPTRAVSGELAALKRLASGALASNDASAVREVATLLERLPAAARAELSRYGAVEAPSPAALVGDPAALQRLHGLIPVDLSLSPRARRPLVKGARYRGAGAADLHRRGRPPQDNLEQLCRELASAYWLVTRRRISRGAGAPFAAFFERLLSILLGGDLDERGDRVLRRVVAWQRSLLAQRDQLGD